MNKQARIATRNASKIYFKTAKKKALSLYRQIGITNENNTIQKKKQAGKKAGKNRGKKINK